MTHQPSRNGNDVVILGGGFAGAVAWRGIIDGAIESGYRAAREIDVYLAG